MATNSLQDSDMFQAKLEVKTIFELGTRFSRQNTAIYAIHQNSSLCKKHGSYGL